MYSLPSTYLPFAALVRSRDDSLLTHGAHKTFLILGSLNALSLLCGLLLVLLAMLVQTHVRLDDPPAHLSGDRNAREGVWLALVAIPFTIMAIASLQLGLKTDGVVVPMTAALVCMLWGGLRVLANAGASRIPARNLHLCGALVCGNSIICAILQLHMLDSHRVI